MTQCFPILTHDPTYAASTTELSPMIVYSRMVVLQNPNFLRLGHSKQSVQSEPNNAQRTGPSHSFCYFVDRLYGGLTTVFSPM